MDFYQNVAGLRTIGSLELIHRACGINFPSQNQTVLTKHFKSFKDVRDSLYVKGRPLIFFPECTRSNGKGVLDIPIEAVQLIQKAIDEEKFKIHALRFDYGLSTSSMQPYNSTDVLGIWHSLIMLSQFLTKMQIQYLFNLQEPDQRSGKQTKIMSPEDLNKKLSQALQSKGREYSLDKNWRDHQEYLKYRANNQ